MENTETSDSQDPKRQGPGVAKWALVAVAAAIVVGVPAWYLAASSGYAAELTAIKQLTSGFEGDRVLMLNADTDPVDEYEPDDVDLVVTYRWGGPEWLRSPLIAVGDPILNRVQTVKIYDPNVTDSVMEPLPEFKSLEAFHLTPNVELDRAAFAVLMREVPDAIVYIEHDNPDYDRPPEGDGDLEESEGEGEDA